MVLSPIKVPSGKPCSERIRFFRTLLVTFAASSAVKLLGGFIKFAVIVSTARGFLSSASYSLTSTRLSLSLACTSLAMSNPRPRYPNALSIPLAPRSLAFPSNSGGTCPTPMTCGLVACAKSVSTFLLLPFLVTPVVPSLNP